MKIPRHVAVIMDGNGRWAKKRGMPRNFGHSQGCKTVENICREAWELGIQYLTVYAFSTENWNRPKSEVDALMKLLHSYMKTCLKTARKNNMRVRVIGDIHKLDTELQQQIDRLVTASQEYDGLQFTIALNYGGRDEILRTTRQIAKDCATGRLQPAEIDETVYRTYLDTGDLPDPDLLIRTSGEQRLSNYLLWQLAYTELYFTDVLWPDFSKEDLQEAIVYYNQRERRFGNVGEEANV